MDQNNKLPVDPYALKIWEIPNFKVLLLQSVAYFFLLFAFYSSVNVYSKLLRENGHENLGFYSLAVMYIFFALGCLIAPSLAAKYKRQRVMIAGSLAYSIWIIAGYFATSKGIDATYINVLVMATSIIQGIGAAIGWVAQGNYMSDCVKVMPERAGTMTSTFWMLVSSSSIFGFIFNSVILGSFEPRFLFMINSFISLLPAVFIACLPDL